MAARPSPRAVEPGERVPPVTASVRAEQWAAHRPCTCDLHSPRQLADVVIVEVPPLLAVSHGEALARAVDVVVIVAACRSTTINQAQRAGEILRRMGAPVLGVALTDVRLSPRTSRQAYWVPDTEPAAELEASTASQLPEASRT